MKIRKNCVVCGKAYWAHIKIQKYCCYGCRMDATKARYTKSINEIPTGTVGTLSELRVAIDLLQKNYEVFRAMSPACSCDLAILKDGQLLRVEVTTGYYNGGKLRHSKTKAQLEKSDIIAIVDPLNHKITYNGEF